MNKQELIEKYEDELKDVQLKFGSNFKTKVYEEFIEDLKQLDEPQEPVVSQFVADWYEEHKDNFEYEVWDWISSKDEPEMIHKEFAFWVNDVENNPIQTLVNMHQFGYTVEKEKRYFVKIKGVTGDCRYLKCVGNAKNWIISNYDEYTHITAKHTRKELEDAGFSEVFNSPLFEVEEVQDDSKV